MSQQAETSATTTAEVFSVWFQPREFVNYGTAVRKGPPRKVGTYPTAEAALADMIGRRKPGWLTAVRGANFWCASTAILGTRYVPDGDQLEWPKPRAS